jgi:hypothetical protein
MAIEDERIRYAVENTVVVRPPKERLATFGPTSVHYYLVTEPLYADMFEGKRETVVREGKLTWERPRIVTPYYLTKFFEGFSEDAKRYAEMIARDYGPHNPLVQYFHKNEPKKLSIVSDSMDAVINRINKRLDRKKDPLSTIIKGIDELWDISLVKFASDVAFYSFFYMGGIMQELESKGFLEMRHGVPQYARYEIEWFFQKVRNGEADPSLLKMELDRWGIFDEYEDRFLDFFRKGL